jgi:hypothetical protein
MNRRAYIDAEQDARSRPLPRYELAGILALFERAKKDAREQVERGIQRPSGARKNYESKNYENKIKRRRSPRWWWSVWFGYSGDSVGGAEHWNCCA